MGIADSIAAASMSMSRLQFETAYDTAMVKKSMDAMEQQAMAFVEMMDAKSGGAFAPPLFVL